jgi:HSP20 family protein
MSIIRWQPFSELLGMYDRVNRLFEEEYLPESKKSGVGMMFWSPQTDIYETKESYVVKMELPGFAKSDIRVEFSNDTLMVRGERKQEEEIKKEDFHRLERSYGVFQRSFTLPKNIDGGKIDANLRDGLLVLTIPKAEEAKTKAIPISVK